MTSFEYHTLADAEDARKLNLILDQCFNSSPDPKNRYMNRIGQENFRILRQNGHIAGGLAIIQMGQWYGGESIPMAGIAAVGISPEYRGTGAAATLLTSMLKEVRSQGVPISALYPATQRLYRKVGYEQGGSQCVWEVPTNSIEISDRLLPIHSINPDHPTIPTLYQQSAKNNNGNLDRNQAIWDDIIKPRKEEVIYAYLIGSHEQPEGYIIFQQDSSDNENIIRIRDWAVLTPAAARRSLTFFADHRSMIEKIRWRGAVVDPLNLLLTEQTEKNHYLYRWMLRLVDVKKSLEKRGYPSGIETELHLEIQDELIPENNGKFCLTVAEGKGEVSEGGKGELKLNIRALASLYTGLYSPHQLQLIGKIEANESALSSATTIFSGSQPWMVDFF